MYQEMSEDALDELLGKLLFEISEEHYNDLSDVRCQQCRSYNWAFCLLAKNFDVLVCDMCVRSWIAAGVPVLRHQ
jgi:hypothetical protein